MKNLDRPEIDRLRDRSEACKQHFGWYGDNKMGRFFLRLRASLNEVCCVIAASGDGWDHVSVSYQDRTPTWAEMEEVKRIFFHDHETAMQLHVPPAEHINHDQNVLHLWRPHKGSIPRPPGIMVGPPPGSR